ncbi:MAG: DNA starvation/stationary phase protection protein [Chlamydiae bacterium]|nr:DNA starvation/stationary phase protection protein [Chlamydiota bacterium]
MEIQVGLTEQNRTRVAEDLASLLADTYAVYLKTQNFHWNVTGPEFYSLHVLFEKQYTELAENIDEVAERIRALGHFIEGSFSAFKERSAIADETKMKVAKEMVAELVRNHEIVIRSARNLSQIAEDENDPATVDLLGRKLNMHEKMAWMLRSQL